MKISRWVNFTWDLGKAQSAAIAAPKQYQLNIVGGTDREQVQNVIEKSFALDPSWNPAWHLISTPIKNSIAPILNLESTACLVLRHGARIIGWTLITTDPHAPEQLIPGPCILMEYRNRGLGTLLLAAALRHLREAGVTQACAITPEGSPAARFLYPKFGGQSCAIAPQRAA